MRIWLKLEKKFRVFQNFTKIYKQNFKNFGGGLVEREKLSKVGEGKSLGYFSLARREADPNLARHEASPCLACLKAKRLGHLQILNETLVMISIRSITNLGTESRSITMNL